MELQINQIFAFDLDGTLIDSEEAIFISAAETLANYTDNKDFEKQVRSTIGRPIREVFESIIGNKEMAEKAAEDFRNHLAEKSHLHTTIFEGVVDSLSYLKNANAKLAIATNKNTWLAKAIVEKMNLDKYFDLVIGQDLAAPKPSPMMLHQISAELNGRLISYCGDTVDDVLCAKSAGTKSIAIASNNQNFNNLSISKPDYLLNSATELLECLKAHF